MIEFICNICGSPNCAHANTFDRESPNCSSCGSSVRVRGIVRALSIELLGIALSLPEFPRLKSLRGIGLTDFDPYASRLAEKFEYKNTFYNRPPQLDICNSSLEDMGKYDFIISSEVFEHVESPGRAFEHACRLLKENGVLILSVPYSLESSMDEHFPDLHEFGMAQVGGNVVL